MSPPRERAMPEESDMQKPAGSSPRSQNAPGPWVPVTNLCLAGEAAALATALEDAGIPSLVRDEKRSTLPDPTAAPLPTVVGQQVCVPAAYLEQARVEAARFYGEAAGGALGAPSPSSAPGESADLGVGAPSGVAAQDPDPLAAQIAVLCRLPPEARGAQLVELVDEWLTEGATVAQVTARLCAAGLDAAEAEALARAAVDERAGPFERRRRWRFQIGAAVAVVGAAWMYLTLPRGLREMTLIDYGGIVVLVLGLGLACYALTMKKPAPGAAEDSGAENPGP